MTDEEYNKQQARIALDAINQAADELPKDDIAISEQLSDIVDEDNDARADVLALLPDPDNADLREAVAVIVKLARRRAAFHYSSHCHEYNDLEELESLANEKDGEL